MAPFIRGDYDVAVFQAFKEVEVAVREAGGFDPSDVGVALMRKAFEKTTGPLRGLTVPEAERDSTAHLFAGAVGLFKNPQSHRHAPISDPAEAVELLLSVGSEEAGREGAAPKSFTVAVASHLLRIVDSRAPKP